MEKNELDLEAVNVLREARSMIEKYGWCQGMIGDKEIGYGARDAIYSVNSTSPIIDRALGMLSESITFDVEGGWWGHLTYYWNGQPRSKYTLWNDAPERTAAEVLAAFDLAITQNSIP